MAQLGQLDEFSAPVAGEVAHDEEGGCDAAFAHEFEQRLERSAKARRVVCLTEVVFLDVEGENALLTQSGTLPSALSELRSGRKPNGVQVIADWRLPRGTRRGAR